VTSSVKFILTASTEVQNVSEGNIEISNVENVIRIELEPKTESITYVYSALLWFSASEYYFHSQNYTVRDSLGVSSERHFENTGF
jgi:hypothetical protein